MAELEGERARLAAQLEAHLPCPAGRAASEPAGALPATGRAARGGAERSLIRDEAAEVLRELIEKVVLVPRAEAKGLDAVLHGDLARILQLCEAADEKSGPANANSPARAGRGVEVSVVAGARNQHYRMPNLANSGPCRLVQAMTLLVSAKNEIEGPQPLS